jgi:hypothetical protein
MLARGEAEYKSHWNLKFNGKGYRFFELHQAAARGQISQNTHISVIQDRIRQKELRLADDLDARRW